LGEQMIDTHYAIPKLANVYDLDSGWSQDRDFYLALAPQYAIDILDLGCGTGLLCEAYAAKGHRVTGVDPANAMLEVARRKSNAAKVNWVQATAQDFRSDKRFDLIIMTGHAFQVLLTDEDVAATFSTMRHHLKPEGRAVFESRNPAINWARRWNYDLTLPDGQARELRSFGQMQEGFLTFDMHYIFSDETLTSTSTLRFVSRSEIEHRLSHAGLQVDSVLGDWSGNSFDPETSEEMIFTAIG
jgi:2-polyprenyl-3-methyl-5-hydroxy-6-metoxy-1,4-benzoquinol methylase